MIIIESRTRGIKFEHYKEESLKWSEPQSTRFEIQQTIMEYLAKKAKIQIFDRNPNLTFIIEMRTKGISITPWPSDYNWITNQRYKVWTPQERIPNKFTVLEEPKQEQSLTHSNFYSIILFITMSAYYLQGMTENRKYEKRTK